MMWMAKQGNRDRLNPRHCPSLELDSLTGRRSSDSIRASGNDCAAPKGRIDDCKPNPLLITKTTCNQGASIDDNANWTTQRGHATAITLPICSGVASPSWRLV